MKKIIKFIKKYQVVILLAFLASLLASYKLLFPTEDSDSPAQPTPAQEQVTTIPTPVSEKGISQDELEESLSKSFPLDPYLPYPGDYYVRYIDKLSLEIEPKSATISAKNEQVIFDWIESHNVDPQSHQINWKQYSEEN